MEKEAVCQQLYSTCTANTLPRKPPWRAWGLQNRWKLKKKLSHYRPGQALSFPRSWGPQNFKTTGTLRWYGYQLTSVNFTPQGIILVLISVRGLSDLGATVRREVLCQWKMSVTPFALLVPLAKEEAVLQGMIVTLTEIWSCYGMEMNVEETKVIRILKQTSPPQF